ncbi:MAG: hypothetical protein ACAH80_17380 [Alphaproteobacteria bacterium]
MNTNIFVKKIFQNKYSFFALGFLLSTVLYVFLFFYQGQHSLSNSPAFDTGIKEKYVPSCITGFRGCPENPKMKRVFGGDPVAPFSAFDKLIIRAGGGYIQSTPGYPSLLKDENFRPFVEEQIKKNFSRCLSRFGKDIPVEMYPGDMDDQEKRNKIVDRLNQETLETGTLTILIKLNYFPPTSRPVGEEDYGTISHRIFRPGLSREDAMNTLFQGHEAAFFPQNTDDAGLKKWFEGYFEGMAKLCRRADPEERLKANTCCATTIAP